MIRRDVDVLVLGTGIAAWCAALDLGHRARSVVVLPMGRPSGAGPLERTAAVSLGPGTYPEATTRWGREETREIWELGREEAAGVREVCRRLGAEGRWRGDGGFLLATTREEASTLADAEDALRDDGFGGEFLDHFMLEARFDVRGIAGAYWSAEEGEYDAGFVYQGLRRRALDAGAREGPPTSGVIVVGSSDVVVEAGGAEWHAPMAILAPDAEEAPHLEGVPALGAPLALAALSRARVKGGPDLPSPARRVDGAAGWAGRDPIDAWRPTGAAPTLTAWLGDIGLGSTGEWPSVEVGFPADGRPVIGRTSSHLIVAWSGAGGPALDWPIVAAQRAVEMAMGGSPAVPAPLRPRTMAPG